MSSPYPATQKVVEPEKFPKQNKILPAQINKNAVEIKQFQPGFVIGTSHEVSHFNYQTPDTGISSRSAIHPTSTLGSHPTVVATGMLKMLRL